VGIAKIAGNAKMTIEKQEKGAARIAYNSLPGLENGNCMGRTP
jgi:hypothetical protein